MSARSGLPRLGVLVSGTGRTLTNLHERCEEGGVAAQIVAVGASRACAALGRAESAGLPAEVLRGGPEPDVGGWARSHGLDWIVLAGYTRLLRIPEGFGHRVVNIHPALLPSFGGRGMYGLRVHRAVLEAGCRVSGCTVHLCDERYDSGPIVAQGACGVLAGDTAETLAARVFELELALYPLALSSLLKGFSVDGGVVRLSSSLPAICDGSSCLGSGGGRIASGADGASAHPPMSRGS